MVGLQLVFKRPAARESPKAMEPPAVSRFLYRDTIIGECNRNPFSLSCMAKSSNFSNLQPLGALFSASSLCFQWVAASFWEKRGVGYLVVKFRLTNHDQVCLQPFSLTKRLVQRRLSP